MSHKPLSVVVPWSLSHYIQLNGFHPLYRALFDQAPSDIELHAWDNVKLHNRLERDIEMRDIVLRAANEENGKLKKLNGKTIEKAYQEYFWPPNRALTDALEGDIEFHHTAPFPSLKRPFVFHCESFAPIFLPFTQQGSGEFKNHEKLRDHYCRIFSNPLCLGIFSHIPETLESLSRFFSNPDIDQKLFKSRIGLSQKSIRTHDIPEKPLLSRPIFLFMNSANQNPKNFFLRGGHIVLRFWKNFITNGHDGLLMLRCAKPSDEEMLDHAVDTSFMKDETGRSIIWAEDYLANHEINALMANAHFFLLPSSSLHSVSIMQAMTLGTIPVITDTVGTASYLADDEHGIVLHGVRAAIWHTDKNTGVLVDQYCRIQSLDDSLVSQMTNRILSLLGTNDIYQKMRKRMMAHALKKFSGEAFSHDFWSTVLGLYKNYKETPSHGPILNKMALSLQDCTFRGDGWTRVFESMTQPMRRIYTGQNNVWELSGAIILVRGNPIMKLNDWSVFARYFNPEAAETTFVNTLDELEGKYLSFTWESREGVNRKLIGFVSRTLMPYPELHGFAASMLKKLRRYRKFLGYRLKSNMKPNNDNSVHPQLVEEGFFDFNVVCLAGEFYAIPRSEGPFEYDKILSKGYNKFFSGTSLSEVKEAIRINVNAQELGILGPELTASKTGV